MNEERVIDYQVLEYSSKPYKNTKGEEVLDYVEDHPLKFFEYLIKVEISKGWTPQGNLTVPQREQHGYKNYYSRVVGGFKQTMVKYQGFVTSKPPQLPQKKKVSWLDLFMNFFVWVFYLVIMLFLLGVGISVVVWIFIVYGLGFFTS